MEINGVTKMFGPGLADGLVGSRSEIAANWADTDEWKPRPSDAPDLRVIDGLAGLLPSMTSLAQESQGSGRPMYLLMGL